MWELRLVHSESPQKGAGTAPQGISLCIPTGRACATMTRQSQRIFPYVPLAPAGFVRPDIKWSLSWLSVEVQFGCVPSIRLADQRRTALGPEISFSRIDECREKAASVEETQAIDLGARKTTGHIVGGKSCLTDPQYINCNSIRTVDGIVAEDHVLALGPSNSHAPRMVDDCVVDDSYVAHL